MEEEMEIAFSKPFSYSDMEKIIQKSRATAPGLTGCSYQMLKLQPEAVKKKLFKLMHHLWINKKQVPKFWKQKGLHGIPKPAIPVIRGANDLRPIGLIEVTRKIWTKMVLARIQRTIRRHHGLQAVAVKADQVAQKADRQQVLALGFLFDDNMRQHLAGDVLAGLGIEHAEDFVVLDHLRQAAVAFCSEGLPLVGPLAGAPGLWLFTGFSAGFSQVPVLAPLLAQALALERVPAAAATRRLQQLGLTGAF